MKLATPEQLSFIRDWEQDLRFSYPAQLPKLDAVQFWCVKDKEEMATFIFRDNPADDHKKVYWFTVNLDTEDVQLFRSQVKMFESVPQKGMQASFWHLSSGWHYIHSTAYEFKRKLVNRQVQILNTIGAT